MISKMAQLHSTAGTQRFFYKDHLDTVTIMGLDLQSKPRRDGTTKINKAAARKVWDTLVNHGWTAKRTET